MNKDIPHRKIILFDGVCNLCNGSVIFVLQWEKEPAFQFASIQSDAGQVLLEWCGLPKDFNQAVVLIDHEDVYLGSTAALKIGQQLRWPWSFFSPYSSRFCAFRINFRIFGLSAELQASPSPCV